jgi:hypothetical protein
MGLVIKSTGSTTELIVDPNSNAMRQTGYKADGTVVAAYATRDYYRASVAVNLVAAAGTAPFFAIQGSSSKIVRIIAIHYNGMTLTATAYQTIVCQRRSTAVNGGTATALVQVPNDSSSPAGTLSICNVYTVAPTAGTLVGTIDTQRFLAADTTPTTLIAEDNEFNFYQDHEDGIILRGVTEGITLSFASAPATAVTMAVSVLWSESDI